MARKCRGRHRGARRRSIDRDGDPADLVVGANRALERVDEAAEVGQVPEVDALEVHGHPIEAPRCEERHDLADRPALVGLVAQERPIRGDSRSWPGSRRPGSPAAWAAAMMLVDEALIERLVAGPRLVDGAVGLEANVEE